MDGSTKYVYHEALGCTRLFPPQTVNSTRASSWILDDSFESQFNRRLHTFLLAEPVVEQCFGGLVAEAALPTSSTMPALKVLNGAWNDPA